MNKKPILRSQITEIATSCTCGGPGGSPGMAPVCLTCIRFQFISERVALRQRPANPAVIALLSRFTLARGAV